MFKWLKINNFTFITEDNCFVKFSENTVQSIAKCKCPASIHLLCEATDDHRFGTVRMALDTASHSPIVRISMAPVSMIRLLYFEG